MRLQVGRAYWTRDGQEMVKIESVNRMVKRGFHYIGVLSSMGEMAWRRSGRFQADEESPFDLIRPVTPDSIWRKKNLRAGGQSPGSEAP